MLYSHRQEQQQLIESGDQVNLVIFTVLKVGKYNNLS